VLLVFATTYEQVSQSIQEVAGSRLPQHPVIDHIHSLQVPDVIK
jgi:hypothetical protein